MKKYRILLSVLSGLLLSLSWPANGFPFISLFALVPLFILEEQISIENRHSLRKIWLYSYISLFIWNLLTTWWIWNSTEFGAIMAIVLNSLFMSWVWVLYSWSKRNFYNSKSAILLFPIYWIAFEYFHLDWDLSWSWLNLGNAFANYPLFIQWYEWTGAFGGSLWIILVNILIYNIIKSKYLIAPSIRIPIKTWIALSLILLLPMLYSLIIYFNYEEKGPEVEIVVVQPNMDPWGEQFLSPPGEVINRIKDLSEPLLSDETKFWIAPESAIQEGLKEPNMWTPHGKSKSIYSLQKYMDQYPNLQLIIGASTWKYLDKETSTQRKTSDGNFYDEYNTAISLNSNDITDVYHKSKLVPGPEKMPFQGLLSPIQDVAFNLGGTVGSLGYDETRKVFYSKDKALALAPLICYESIYGGFVAEFVRNKASILAIITNDGWWGNTAGHKQHFAYARLRAIENRRSIARSANTGISGFINQRGETIETTPYWIQDARKAKLSANTKMTFYTIFGDYIGRIFAFLSILLILISLSVFIKNKNPLKTN